jgi:hypothetical protein
MSVDEWDDDDILAAVASLRAGDASHRHTERLRHQCHVLLQSQSEPEKSAVMMNGTAFQRVIGPALAGAWCLAYLMEIVRRTVAIYLGAQ